jgi:hypothetical protein
MVINLGTKSHISKFTLVHNMCIFFLKQGNWQLGVLLKQANCSNWVSKFNYLISYVGQKKFTKIVPHSLIVEKKRSRMKRNDNKKSLPNHINKQFELHLQWNYHIMMCLNKRLANWPNYGTPIQLRLWVINDQNTRVHSHKFNWSFQKQTYIELKQVRPSLMDTIP